MNLHEKYIKRCIGLAKKGFGKVAPNPMVGCVIVCDGKIIGEGYHKNFGNAHAEVNAVNSVKDKSLLKNSVLYVNLEPCSYFGKTPPCADLIIERKIKYVVIGTIDPNSLVGGKGIQKLISSGCDVKVGVMEDDCRELNRRFFSFHKLRRPYIILKWAETKDKYIGVSGFRFQVSGSKVNKLVHQWRGEEQAIMVGTNTALTDNPKLTVRNINGKNPSRVVIDRELKIPLRFHLLDGCVPTIVFTGKKQSSNKNLEYVTIDFSERSPSDSKNVLKQILNELHRREIQSLIVEGGAKLLNSFIKENLWDEARVITSNKKLNDLFPNGTGVEAPKIKIQNISKEKTGSDELKVYRNKL